MKSGKNTRIVLAGLSFASLQCIALGNANVNFNSGVDEWNNNFRTPNAGYSTVAYATDSATPPNGYISIVSVRTSIYDADSWGPNQSLFTVTKDTPLTITADVNFRAATSGFGFYLIDPANESSDANNRKSRLALFSVDTNTSGTAGTAERFRFWNDVGAPANGNSPVGINATQYMDSTDNGLTLNKWITLSLTYSINDQDQTVLTLSAAPQGESNPISYQVVWDQQPALNTFKIGFRMAASGTVSTPAFLDNFTISQIPEPASASFLMLGGLLALTPRFRRQRHLGQKFY